jgi:hypothetical protein
MDRQQILDELKTLSLLDSSYADLYQYLNYGGDEAKAFLSHLAKQNFVDVVDMIMYFEG